MIHILTDPAVGGTFLSWTIHYLAGHTRYFLLEKNQWTAITNTPIQHHTAHNFIPNQPNRIADCDPSEFLNFAATLTNVNCDHWHVMYFHQFDNKETTRTAIEYSNANAEKLIVIDTSNSTLYHCSFRKRGTRGIGNNVILRDDKSHQDFLIETFFKESKKQWDDLGLTSVWDFREFLALNIRPFEQDHIYQHIDKTKTHFVILGSELWTALDLHITNLFEYLDIKLDSTRWANWLTVYEKWRVIHHQKLTFATHFDRLIQAIFNNYNIDLTKFDLDIEQEAAIQHALIYQHNLNLKTYQLEKFVNTSQLHNLLEPNIHPLSS